MKITIKQLKSLGACDEAVRWLRPHKNKEIKYLAKILIKEKHFDWANWYVTRLFTKPQAVQYSIFAAEQCITQFEMVSPEDKRPRAAIEAAKRWLESPSSETKFAARSAARSAWSAESAESAAWSAARSAESAAESAAWSAESAESAFESAAWSAWSAEHTESAELKLVNKAINILVL